jgi:hypothetical protein
MELMVCGLTLPLWPHQQSLTEACIQNVRSDLAWAVLDGSNPYSLLKWVWRPKQCVFISASQFLAHDLNTEFGNQLWVGDSLLRLFYRAWKRRTGASNSLFFNTFMPVNAFSLRPMTALGLQTCNKECKRSACTYNGTECPPESKRGALTEFDRRGLYWTQHLTNEVDTLVLGMGHHIWKLGYNPSFLDKENNPNCNCTGEKYPMNKTASDFKKMKECCEPFKYKYPAAVRGIATFLKQQKFSGRVIFVTATPGFWPCGRTQPNEFPHQHNKDEFSWHKPATVEHFWSETFASIAPEIRFSVLNITFAAASRGDAHPAKNPQSTYSSARNDDCLHVCPVGIPDLWVDMLLTKGMSMRTTKQDPHMKNTRLMDMGIIWETIGYETAGGSGGPRH